MSRFNKVSIRVLALVLAVSMLCGVLPVIMASAAGGDTALPPKAGWDGGGAFEENGGFSPGKVLPPAAPADSKPPLPPYGGPAKSDVFEDKGAFSPGKVLPPAAPADRKPPLPSYGDPARGYGFEDKATFSPGEAWAHGMLDEHLPPVPPHADEGSGDDHADEDGFVPDEVLAPADSLEQAQEIAAAYGLALKSYAYGIAVLTAPDAQEAVAQSIAAHNMTRRSAKPLPQLSLNLKYHICETNNNYAGFRDTYKSTAAYYDSYTYVADKRPVYRRTAFVAENQDDAEPPRQRQRIEAAPLEQKYRANAISPGQLHNADAASMEQWHRDEMDMERAWPISTGEGVVVAVIDTGIDIDHPAFTGRISVKSYNTYTDMVGLEHVRDDYGHGTHVSGIIAASMDEAAGVCGVAPDAELLMIKANIPDVGWFYSADLYRAINYAAQNGADIINMSLGRGYADGWGADELEQAVIANAVASGVTVICAAGNSSDSHAGYPAAYPECIAVSATKQGYSFERAYSNHGPEIAIAAPGSDIYSTVMGGGYDLMSGTSMASPNTAGVAALIVSLHPEYNPQQVREALCKTARDAGEVGWDEYFGYGIANAYAAVLGPDALYNVTYDFRDSLRAPVSIKVIPGNTLLEPGIPLRAGYAFEGWFVSGTDEEYDFTNAVTGNLTLEAGWVTAEAGMYILEFPDVNFRHEVLRLLKEQDGVSRKESRFVVGDADLLASITWLSVGGMIICDMTGLKYFTGLESLGCSYNQLTALNVSKNTALTSLNCWDNRLTELDVSNNHLLEYLDCGINQLSELDVSKNTALQTLWCDGNLLTELDVKSNIKISGEYDGFWIFGGLNCSYNQLEKLDLPINSDLKVLSCNNNLLTELNISNNTALEWLGCFGNRLSVLNVSHNTVLKGLNCSANQLTALDLSKNTALEYISCWYNLLTELDISNNTALEMLYCEDNKLTALDVSQNIALKDLSCEYNRLSSLDTSKNTALEWLVCPNNLLTALDVSKNTALEYLYCTYNYIPSTDDVIGWQEIELTLGKNFIFNPQRGGNPPTGEDITAYFKDEGFLAAVREITDILEGPILDYDVMDIRDLFIPYWNTQYPIADLAGIEYFSSLTWLYCYGQQLKELNLSKNTMLEWLYCSDNQISMLDVSKNIALRELSCGYNRLSTLDVSNNTALEWLICHNNLLTELYVSKNTTLEYLYCPLNYIESTDAVIGWQEIGLVLYDSFIFDPQRPGPPPIGEDITAYLKDEGFLAVVRDITGIPEGPILDYDVMDISDLYIPGWSTQYPITDLSGIEYFTSLTYLNCSSQQLKELDISKNIMLEWLYCEDNQLVTLNVSQNITLRDLFCGYNQLSALDVSNNITLHSLFCGYNQLLSLDVNRNTELEWLSCPENLLISLDVSKNSSLTWLDCCYNYMRSIDNVTGWWEIGLILNNNFLFYMQYTDGITLTPSNPTKTIRVGEGETGRVPITITAYANGSVYVQSSGITSGNNPALYNETGDRIADDEAGNLHWGYTIPAGQTMTIYAGTYNGETASYTITATFPIVTLTPSNPTAAISVGDGVNGRMPIKITAPAYGSVYVCSSDITSGYAPALYDEYGYMIAYNETGNMHWEYFISAGQTIFIYAGTYSNEAADYTVTATFPPITLTPAYPTEIIYVGAGESGREPILITAPSNGSVYVQSSNITSGQNPALYNEAGNRIADDEAGDWHWGYTIPADQTMTICAGTFNDEAACYTVTATFPTSGITLTPDKPAATISVGKGANGRIPITITAPSDGSVYVQSSNIISGHDPALYNEAGYIIADDEAGNSHWGYTIPAGQTMTIYAGTYSNGAAFYTVTATFNIVTLTPSNPAATICIGEGEYGRVPIKITAPLCGDVYVRSSDITSGSDPALYDEYGYRIADDEAGNMHWEYFIPAGQTMIIYAGTYGNGAACYTVTATFPICRITLTPVDPAATINVGEGESGRVPITITAPSNGSVYVRSSDITSGHNPALYNEAGDRIADDEAGDWHWGYTIPADQTMTIYAGTFNDEAACYTVTATFPTSGITLTPDNPKATISVGFGESNRIPITITAPSDNDIYVWSSNITCGNDPALYDEAGFIIADDEMGYLHWGYNIPAGQTMTVYAGTYGNGAAFYTVRAIFPITLTPSEPAKPLRVGEGKFGRVPITISAPSYGDVYVQSSDLTNGYDPALYDEASRMIADDEAGYPHWRYTIPAGQTMTIYAGTYSNEEADYTVTATFPPSYNFRVYMQSDQTALETGDILYVDVMLTGDINYTQMMASIAYESDLLEFTGSEYLSGLSTEVKKDGVDKISVRNVPSINMFTGAPCNPPVKVATLKFTVKYSPPDENVVSFSPSFTNDQILPPVKETELTFASINVFPTAIFAGATTAPGNSLSISLGSIGKSKVIGVVTGIDPINFWTGTQFAPQYQRVTIFSTEGKEVTYVFSPDFRNAFNYFMNGEAAFGGANRYWTGGLTDEELTGKWRDALDLTGWADAFAELSEGDIVHLALDERENVKQIINYVAYEEGLNARIQVQAELERIFIQHDPPRYSGAYTLPADAVVFLLSDAGAVSIINPASVLASGFVAEKVVAFDVNSNGAINVLYIVGKTNGWKVGIVDREGYSSTLGEYYRISGINMASDGKVLLYRPALISYKIVNGEVVIQGPDTDGYLAAANMINVINDDRLDDNNIFAVGIASYNIAGNIIVNGQRLFFNNDTYVYDFEESDTISSANYRRDLNGAYIVAVYDEDYELSTVAVIWKNVADGNTDINTDADTEVDADIDVGSDVDTDADTDAEVDMDTDIDADTDPDIYTDVDVDTNPYADTDVDICTNPEADTDTDTDADTEADSDIGSDVSAIIFTVSGSNALKNDLPAQNLVA